MTQTKKCDICRSRKVKCDEKKPKCGPCRKKNRLCAYTFGKATFIVREDPKQYSGHGKVKIAPLIYPLLYYKQPTPIKDDMPKDGPLTNREGADFEKSQYEPGSGESNPPNFALLSKRMSPTIITGPSRPADLLASRWVYLLGPHTVELDPFTTHDSWIGSIPSRIGHSDALDLAIEYAVSAFAGFRDPTLSKQRTALLNKGRALKALRAALGNEKGKINYDVVVATKLHSYAEIFVAAGTFSYTLHCLGLSELLRSGVPVGMDREHYWSLAENTYLDEATDALLAGRLSTYDTAYYRSLTDPLKFKSDDIVVPNLRVASVSIMHSFIQLPRLANLVRRATSDVNDTKSLQSALDLSKQLWSLDPCLLIDNILQSSTTVAYTPPSDIADIIPQTLEFDSVQPIILCMRYWLLRIYLSSLLQTIQYAFPTESATASVPELLAVQQSDVEAATNIAQSLSSTLSLSSSLPIVPLRVLSSLSASAGSWYRLVQRLTRAQESLAPSSFAYAKTSQAISDAKRMEIWAIEQSNRIHDRWGVERGTSTTFEALFDSMAGGKMPDWMEKRICVLRSFSCVEHDHAATAANNVIGSLVPD